MSVDVIVQSAATIVVALLAYLGGRSQATAKAKGEVARAHAEVARFRLERDEAHLSNRQNWHRDLLEAAQGYRRLMNTPRSEVHHGNDLARASAGIPGFVSGVVTNGTPATAEAARRLLAVYERTAIEVIRAGTCPEADVNEWDSALAALILGIRDDQHPT